MKKLKNMHKKKTTFDHALWYALAFVWLIYCAYYLAISKSFHIHIGSFIE